jgi:hypothetical protein
MLAGIVVLYALYIPLHFARAPHASEAVREVLVWGITAAVVASALIVLFALPIAAARWWRVSAVASVIIAAALMGMTAHYALQVISVINDCEYERAVPLHVVGCN